jgi:hypothetical protein
LLGASVPSRSKTTSFFIGLLAHSSFVADVPHIRL